MRKLLFNAVWFCWSISMFSSWATSSFLPPRLTAGAIANGRRLPAAAAQPST